MTDPSGVPSALGIERVEWFAEGGDRLTVQVTGRWRRRRPPSSGQPLLVVEAHGVRHRFPAMPEPPSLTGTVPGTWRMSFSVPASLAPYLAQRVHLQLGAMVVPLPVAVEAAVGVRTAVQHEQRRRAESEAVASRLSNRIEQLEAELEQARRELAERGRARRAADQRAHAERSLRLELEEQLAAAARHRGHSRDALGELAAAEERVRELEQQLEATRRRADEAEHLAAAARAERGRAVTHAIRPKLRDELELLSELAPAPRRTGRRLSAALEPGPLVQAELEMIAGRQAGAERLEATLAALRVELTDLRSLAERSAHAYEAIAQVREQIAALRAGGPEAATAPAEGGGADAPAALAPPEPPASPSTLIEPERLEAAQARLQEAVPREEHAAARKAWLWPVFRTLAGEDAMSAGRLLLGLLPAQSRVHPEPLAYDLTIGERASVQVTVRDGSTLVDVADSPREPEQVQFQLQGELPSIARRLVAGRFGRRLRRGLARVRGDRRALGPLLGLLREPLTLIELHEAGARIDPQLVFMLASLMIEPAWTKGEQFTIAHRLSDTPSAVTYMHVRDGQRPAVSEEHPSGPVATTIACPADLLLAVLAGERPAEAYVRGEERPLALVQNWLELAQSA